MKRILVLLATATVVMAAAVSAAQAEVLSNETHSYAWSGFLPCANGGAGENLGGWIDWHDLVTLTDNGNVYTFQIQFEPHGTVIGRTTGDIYQVTGVMRATDVEILPGGEYRMSMTYVSNYQVIGPGPENNLRMREIAHVTIDGDDVVVEHDDVSIECA